MVVADLVTVNVILGMDFLTAYDADISRRTDTISFRAGAMIHTLMEEEGLDHISVRRGQDSAMLAGHLNRCQAHVDCGTLRGTFLFGLTHALDSAHCRFEAQMVEVANGAVDLYVEHRGACQASELPTDLMLGELRQLGATKVTTSHRRTDLYHTIYQICGKHKYHYEK